MNINVITENFGFFFIGITRTVEMTILVMVGGIVCGTCLALARMAHNRVISYPAIAIVEVLRGTPILMLIFWCYFMLPRVIGISVKAYYAGLFALLLFNSSYMAEIIRAGIQSVPVGQVEAAKSTGLKWWLTIRHIVLPQAFSNMMPALISQGVMLYKTTALVYIIGVLEFFRAAVIVNNREFCPYEIYGFVALIYLIPSTIGSLISRTLERRRTRERGL